jgi:UDP-hydrolysing UDP-N-acetyl-D-glucosamine 2-epimerase
MDGVVRLKVAGPSRRTLGVLSTGRQDWGILRRLCGLLAEDSAFELKLFLGGMHCSRQFGQTARMVREEGFIPTEELNWIDETSLGDAAEQASIAMSLTADALRRQKIDALILVGDRFEVAAVAIAATVLRVPLIHLHGGEETEGAFDNALRHSITKLSHLHFTSHPDHSARVIAMGEHPSTVYTVGAPGLDNLTRKDLPNRAELEEYLKTPLEPPVVIVTVHPATLDADPEAEVSAVVEAMSRVEATYIITLPNVDPGNEIIRAKLNRAADLPRRTAIEALGEKRYWGLLRIADAMLGNSSSALIEAPAVFLPAVNVGQRQKGRIRGSNIIDVQADAQEITAGLNKALDSKFRIKVRQSEPPFGVAGASERIVSVLRSWVPPVPPIKRFYSR